MTKKIKLTRGFVALVDDEDYDYINQWKWAYWNKYAGRSSRKSDGVPRNTLIIMHRVITNCPGGMVVDHINHNTLDNRKENLRICTQSQNLGNRLGKKNGTSKYKGVSWNGASGKWGVTFEQKWLGTFTKETDAANAYNKAAFEKYGSFALLNEI